MNARFFYAPYMLHEKGTETWPKLFVLTDDDVLYCEYLFYMEQAFISKSFNFESFKANHYSYEGYQHLEEISYQRAQREVLTQQGNWIDRYLREKEVM